MNTAIEAGIERVIHPLKERLNQIPSVLGHFRDRFHNPFGYVSLSSEPGNYNGITDPSKRVFIGFLGETLLVGLAAACAPKVLEQNPVVPPAQAAELASPTAKSDLATAEAQKKPEAKIVGNGAIIPEELSVTGVMRDFEYQGQVYKIALYNLPDGTPITAPKNDYFVARNAGNPFIGSSLSVFNPVDLTLPHIVLSGSLQVVNRLSRNVKEGEIIAYIQDTGEKMFGEYNFATEITEQDPKGTGFKSSNDATYKKYLPDLPKGPRIVQTQPIQSSSGNVYLPKEK